MLCIQTVYLNTPEKIKVYYEKIPQIVNQVRRDFEKQLNKTIPISNFMSELDEYDKTLPIF